jgi:hypothetical protein
MSIRKRVGVKIKQKEVESKLKMLRWRRIKEHKRNV